MKWKIKLSAEARQDLRDIYEYIAFQLSEPQTASQQIHRILERIRSLDQMPARHRRYNEEPWYSKGVRFFPVNKYLIFYLSVSENNTVMILRIIYGGRNIAQQLDETTDFTQLIE